MNDSTWALLFLLITIVFSINRKVYLYYLPDYELRRRARKHESPARELYKAVAYGDSLHLLLNLRLGISASATLVLLSRSSLSPWVSFILALIILAVVFWLIPATPVSEPEIWLTKQLSPILLRIINYLHSPLERVSGMMEPLKLGKERTILFEKEDLIKWLKRQSYDPSSRLGKQERMAVEHVLSFSDYLVRDRLTPARSVKTVLANDTVGPILIDEIHKSGQTEVLVRDKKKGRIVGSLSFSKLSLESTGHVSDLMDKSVCYIHEEDNLNEVIRAYFKTGRSLFVVIDNSEDFTGVIRIRDVIEQLLGNPESAEDFDDYASSSAVSTRHMPKDQTEEKLDEESVKTDDEVIE